jgi:hypothetical protein
MNTDLLQSIRADDLGGFTELGIIATLLVMSQHPLASTKFGYWIPDVDVLYFLEYVGNQE